MCLPPPLIFITLSFPPQAIIFMGLLGIYTSHLSLNPEFISFVPNTVSPFVPCFSSWYNNPTMNLFHLKAGFEAFSPPLNSQMCTHTHTLKILLILFNPSNSTMPLESMPLFIPHGTDLILFLLFHPFSKPYLRVF